MEPKAMNADQLEAELIEELANYQDANGLPHQCAFEQMHEDISVDQKLYLQDFSQRWDRMEAQREREREGCPVPFRFVHGARDFPNFNAARDMARVLNEANTDGLQFYACLDYRFPNMIIVKAKSRDGRVRVLADDTPASFSRDCEFGLAS